MSPALRGFSSTPLRVPGVQLLGAAPAVLRPALFHSIAIDLSELPARTCRVALRIASASTASWWMFPAWNPKLRGPPWGSPASARAARPRLVRSLSFSISRAFMATTMRVMSRSSGVAILYLPDCNVSMWTLRPSQASMKVSPSCGSRMIRSESYAMTWVMAPEVMPAHSSSNLARWTRPVFLSFLVALLTSASTSTSSEMPSASALSKHRASCWSIEPLTPSSLTCCFALDARQ